MRNMINQLLEVDHKARALIDEAEQYYEQTIAETERQKIKMSQTFRSNADMHLISLRESESIRIQEETTEIRRVYESLENVMENQYNTLHTQWEEEIFNRCVPPQGGQ